MCKVLFEYWSGLNDGDHRYQQTHAQQSSLKITKKTNDNKTHKAVVISQSTAQLKKRNILCFHRVKTIQLLSMR